MHHPDAQSPGSKSESDAEYESALNNLAYQTLTDPEKRLKHILESQFGKEPDTSSGEDQDFLMDMMELHESVQESFGDEELHSACLRKLESMEQESLALAAGYLDQIEENLLTQEGYEALSMYYHRLKYFSRLRQQLKHAEPEL